MMQNLGALISLTSHFKDSPDNFFWQCMRMMQGTPATWQQALGEVAAALQATPTHVALAWLRRLPGNPLPILGSLRQTRIDEALAGSELQLDAPTWFYLTEAARGIKAP